MKKSCLLVKPSSCHWLSSKSIRNDQRHRHSTTTLTTKTIADVVDEGGTGLDCHAIVLMMKRRKQDVGSKSLDRLPNLKVQTYTLRTWTVRSRIYCHDLLTRASSESNESLNPTSPYWQIGFSIEASNEGSATEGALALEGQ
jgi:hypothetical protein